jgi:hypothetical protein
MHVEVFGDEYPGKEHFDTGPVVGFAVRNLGPTWQHFRGPDGKVYELVAD